VIETLKIIAYVASGLVGVWALFQMSLKGHVDRAKEQDLQLQMLAAKARKTDFIISELFAVILEIDKIMNDLFRRYPDINGGLSEDHKAIREIIKEYKAIQQEGLANAMETYKKHVAASAAAKEKKKGFNPFSKRF